MTAELRLPALALPGLTPDSLGNYLASLGLLRVLSRTWPNTRIAWRDEVLHVVGGPPTLEALLDELLRVAGTQADPDVSKREWTQYDRAWLAAQKKSTKTDSGTPLACWQAAATESQLRLCAAHAVPLARVGFNPLLGSGGNAGRRDFAAGWRKAVAMLAAAPQPRGRRKRESAPGAGGVSIPDERRRELEAFLLGRPLAWLVDKVSAGSWFSSATKLYNSGQSPAREGRISPWAMVLACEGLAFFVGGASRRLGARTRAMAAFPFVTRAAAPEVAGEAGRVKGEIWAPLWRRPMSLAEVSTLFARGRAELRGRGALTPGAFAAAMRQRGVDAGVSEFRRFTLARTTSANTFEPRLEARFRLDTGSGAADATARTLALVAALIEQPGFPGDLPRDGKMRRRRRVAGLRGPVEAALLAVAAEPERPETGVALLDAMVRALDRIDRNREFRARQFRWEPLPLRWLPSLFAQEPPGVEARLALSLVSSFPSASPFATYRFGVEWKHGATFARYTHVERPPARWVWGPGELARVLGAVLTRRLLDQQSHSDTPDRARAPLPATMAQVHAWLAGDVDEALLAAWLGRLALFDWRWVPPDVLPLAPGGPVPPVAAELALLGLVQPLVDQRPLVIRDLSAADLLAAETGARTPEAARALVTLIGAGSLDAAVRLASSRYAMAGLRLAAFAAPWSAPDPERLVAALLFTVPDRDRTVLCQRWLRPARRQQGGEPHA